MVLMLFLAIISLLRLTTALTPDLFLHGVQLRLRYDGTDWLSPGGTLDTQGDKEYHVDNVCMIDEE